MSIEELEKGRGTASVKVCGHCANGEIETGNGVRYYCHKSGLFMTKHQHGECPDWQPSWTFQRELVSIIEWE
jgi:hypothetical protein